MFQSSGTTCSIEKLSPDIDVMSDKQRNSGMSRFHEQVYLLTPKWIHKRSGQCLCRKSWNIIYALKTKESWHARQEY